MNKLTDKYQIFPILVVLLGSGAIASVADSSEKQTGDRNGLVEQATFSPRAYCRTTGGVVSETQFKSLYLCCYESKSKCVLTDTEQSVSWLIPYSERAAEHTRLIFK